MSVIIKYLPIYSDLFSAANDPLISQLRTQDWISFNSNPKDFSLHITARAVDFSIQTTVKNKKFFITIKKIISFLISIILFPLDLFRKASRYVAQRIFMSCIYPAQSYLFFKSRIKSLNLQLASLNSAQNLWAQHFVFRQVTLERDSIRYSGLLVGHISTLNNRKWALQAVGNCTLIEDVVCTYARYYFNNQCNLLLINGPSVGASQGQATPLTMGQAQEIGIYFLEQAIQARSIFLVGHSLGAASIAQAILQHTFKQDINYTVISQNSFDQISHVAAEIIGWSTCSKKIISELVKWSGCEIDLLEASKKFLKLFSNQVGRSQVHKDS
jgi:hypothetical protein